MSPFAAPRARRFVGVALLAASAAAPAHAASGVSLELNRFEQKDAACRISLLIGNPGDKALDSLKLDLVFFDKDGVISRRLAVEAGPVRAAKTSVKLFDLPETPCDSVNKLLLNEVTACGGAEDCLALVTTSSRVKSVEFSK
ncbi:hypothetical protein [Methylopila sp. M107]|uniref:hypothetical protein n=1 Tax=Methylopila sp. M107 TaxID=1101190 RepID=UPI000380AF65|nr:hypothetical protein [Methylopila sp. M107]